MRGSGRVRPASTPAKNSPLEFYNLIQLIDPHAFSSRGLMDPEQFIDRFLRIESREIIDMTLKVSMRSVVDGFKNLDDLRTIIHRYGEFRTGVAVSRTMPEPPVRWRTAAARKSSCQARLLPSPPLPMNFGRPCSRASGL